MTAFDECEDRNNQLIAMTDSECVLYLLFDYPEKFISANKKKKSLKSLSSCLIYFTLNLNQNS